MQLSCTYRFPCIATTGLDGARPWVRSLPCLLLLLAITGLDAAELPKKAQLNRYASLWQSSPFTTKPKLEDPGPTVNPFEDLALKGIAPIAGGYLITLINRKDPSDVTSIDTDRPAASEYKFVKVDRNPDKPLGTVVTLTKGSSTGTVAYDDKLSTLKPPAAKNPQQHPPGQPQIPGQPPQPPQPGQRQPRSRVIPPPTAAPQPGAQPVAQPGVQPGGRPGAGGIGPSSRGNSSSRQRPSRR